MGVADLSWIVFSLSVSIQRCTGSQRLGSGAISVAFAQIGMKISVHYLLARSRDEFGLKCGSHDQIWRLVVKR